MDAGGGKEGWRCSLRDTSQDCVRAMEKGRDKGKYSRVDLSPLGVDLYKGLTQ